MTLKLKQVGKQACFRTTYVFVSSNVNFQPNSLLYFIVIYFIFLGALSYFQNCEMKIIFLNHKYNVLSLWNG